MAPPDGASAGTNGRRCPDIQQFPILRSIIPQARAKGNLLAFAGLLPKNLTSIGTLDIINALRYYPAVIKSFRCSDTEALAKGNRVKRFANLAVVARRKLRQLEIAGRLDDLRIPPGNHLEALKGNREGQYSVRIDSQFRVCFRWTESGAEDVEIVDYH